MRGKSNLVKVGEIVALACAAGFVASGPGACAAASISFKGAQLGMTADAWHALTPPQGLNVSAQAHCSADAAAGGASAARMSPGDEVCSYVTRVGAAVLPDSIPLMRSYRASDLQYVFDRSRLSAIRFRAPIDAFSDAVAMLEGKYGPPTGIVRDTVRTPDGRLARVTETWRTAGGEIQLVDPVPPWTRLAVSMTGGARASQAMAAGGASSSH